MTGSWTKVRHVVLLCLVWGAHEIGSVTVTASMPPPICEEVCSSSTACDELCYENMMEFENGNDISCLEFGVFDFGQVCCGDYICNKVADEGMNNCAADCAAPIPVEPTCGLYGCEQGENCLNCSGDCGTCGSGSTSCDSDGRCESGEARDCEDCKATGFCRSNSDCPSFQGNTYHYACIDDRCVLDDLPLVTNTCTNNSDCTIGHVCKNVPVSYHGSTYVCPGSQPSCKVCIPDWVR